MFELIHRRAAWVWAAMLLLTLVVLGYACREWRKAAMTREQRSASLGVFKLKPGPWGDVSCIPITISPPLEFIPEFLPADTAKVVWRFPGMSQDGLRQYLTELGISDALREKLLSDAHLDIQTKGLVVAPDRASILGLSANDRARLYLGLMQFAENPDHVKAFRFCGSSLTEWFQHVKLRSDTIAKVEPLVYRIGRFLFFADLRTIESDLASPAERLMLIKALSQERTFLVQLNISSGSDIEELVKYWGRQGQAKDIRPILESLAGLDSEDGETIGISHLLPPFARRRIFTFPVPAERVPESNRDCHWTALNFFSVDPSDEYCDAATVAKTIIGQYHRIYGDLKVGDLALFFTGQNTYIHSAVYVADDIYFTKNGSLSTRPWMFMRLDDMKEYYPALKPLEIRHYRRNDL